jgi:hypothetical protein
MGGGREGVRAHARTRSREGVREKVTERVREREARWGDRDKVGLSISPPLNRCVCQSTIAERVKRDLERDLLRSERAL